MYFEMLMTCTVIKQFLVILPLKNTCYETYIHQLVNSVDDDAPY